MVFFSMRDVLQFFETALHTAHLVKGKKGKLERPGLERREI
jgi:hypothetical protein